MFVRDCEAMDAHIKPTRGLGHPQRATGPLSQLPGCCCTSSSFLRPPLLSASVKTSLCDMLSAKCCGEESPGLRVKLLTLWWWCHTFSPLQEKRHVEERGYVGTLYFLLNFSFCKPKIALNKSIAFLSKYKFTKLSKCTSCCDFREPAPSSPCMKHAFTHISLPWLSGPSVHTVEILQFCSGAASQA